MYGLRNATKVSSDHVSSGVFRGGRGQICEHVTQWVARKRGGRDGLETVNPQVQINDSTGMRGDIFFSPEIACQLQ